MVSRPGSVIRITTAQPNLGTFEPEPKGTSMRTHILIAAVLLMSTSAHAETRGLVVPQATPIEAPVVMSAEQLAAQQFQQAAAQPAAPAPVVQQPVAQAPGAPAQAINGPHVQQQPQQAQLTPEQQAAQQQAMRRQQMEQQRRMQQQQMQQQRMMRQQMARNMSLEQKVAYKVHEVKTQVKRKLVHALFR